MRTSTSQSFFHLGAQLLILILLLLAIALQASSPTTKNSHTTKEDIASNVTSNIATDAAESCTVQVPCRQIAIEPESKEPNGELLVPEKTIAAGEHLILRYDLLPPDHVEERFPPGFNYYYVDRFGLFDMTHIKHGKAQMERVLRQINSGYVQLSFVTQKSPTTDTAIRLTGIYHVAPNLSYKQRLHAALGIVMDFEQLIEAHQSPGSSFSVEDLPSDYVGYFIALNPEWQPQELLTLLDSDKAPTGFNPTVAHLYKSFRRNREFRPIPKVGADPVNWPLLLQMEPAGRWSGYWTRTTVIATRDQRAWWQRWGDWGIKAVQILF